MCCYLWEQMVNFEIWPPVGRTGKVALDQQEPYYFCYTSLVLKQLVFI